MPDTKENPWPFQPDDQVTWRDARNKESRRLIKKIDRVPPYTVIRTLNISASDNLTGEPLQFLLLRDQEGKRIIADGEDIWERHFGPQRRRPPEPDTHFDARHFKLARPQDDKIGSRSRGSRRRQ